MALRSIYMFYLAIICQLIGCSSNSISQEVGALNDSNIKRVANLYSGYQFRHGWHGPRDEHALKTDHGLSNEQLQMMNIDPQNIDAIFNSDRDHKPFDIRYGVSGGPNTTNALVFEHDGVAGKKIVAFNGAVTEECDGSRYKDLWEHGGRPNNLVNQPSGRPDASFPSRTAHN